MSTLLTVFFLVTLGSIISLAAGLLLFASERAFRAFHLYLVAFAAGTLVGAALFDLLPEAIEHTLEAGASAETPFLFAALGVATFFLLEKFVHWYHDHVGHGHGQHSPQAIVPAITLGDGLHNFLDGSIIAAATLTDYRLGLLTALAVFLHEIPQEVGDFSVLRFGGLSRRQAILFNLLTAATAYLGAGATWLLSEQLEAATLPIVGFTAGAFLFIALGELVPELVHKEKNGLKTTLLALTLVVAMLAVRLLGQAVGVGH